MARIGGNIPDMQGAAEVMTVTGSAASETGSEASGVSARMEAEIADVTAALTAHFAGLHQSLREALARNRARLSGTDWQGQAYEQALAAEADLNAQTSAFVERAQAGVEEFKAAMVSQAQAFVTSVQGEYTAVMGNIDAAFADFGAATRTHADNLVNVDQSFRYTG